MINDIHDLGLVLDSKVKLVVIESWDERRVLETLTSLAVKRGLGLYTWAVTEGLQRLGFAADVSEESASLEPEAALKLIKHDPQPNLYVLCDLHPFLVDNPKLVRLLKEIALAEGAHKPTLVLVSHALKLPVEVQRYAARFALALPSEEELLAIVRDEATLKHFHRQGDTVMLLADNAAVCPPMIYAGPQLNEIQIEGRAVGFCRGL